MALHKDSLEAKIASKEVKICVVGLGYVGLPLIHAALQAKLIAFGYDIDESKIQSLLAGRGYLKHTETDWIKPSVDSGRFIPTTDITRLADADAILICVPTPLTETRDPDLSHVISTARQIASQLRPGQLICLESTTYPTTTRDVLLPELEKSGLKHGQDFFVAYSPEREDPGNKRWTTRDIPKVVGGLDKTATELAVRLYQIIVRAVVPVSTAEVAEAAKILENTFRAVNIALVNETKILCERMGIDVWEVIEAAQTKPFGFLPFYPGPGLGGHCISIDPHYLAWTARRHGITARLIEVAADVNTSMPSYVVSRLIEALRERQKSIEGSRIGVLGVAYKPDVDDARESPSFVIMSLLFKMGASVSYNDPHIPLAPFSLFPGSPPLEGQALTAQYLEAQDCVVIATHHSDYDYDFIVQNAQLVVDTRNATRDVADNRERIIRA